MLRGQISWAIATLLMCTGSSAVGGCSAAVTERGEPELSGPEVGASNGRSQSNVASNAYVQAAIADGRVARLASALGLTFEADATQVRDLRTATPSHVPGVDTATLAAATQAAPIGVSFRGRTRVGNQPAVLNVALSADRGEVVVAAAKVGTGDSAATYVPGDQGAVRVNNTTELKSALSSDATIAGACQGQGGASATSDVGHSACAIGWEGWVGIIAGVVLLIGVLFGIPNSATPASSVG